MPHRVLAADTSLEQLLRGDCNSNTPTPVGFIRIKGTLAWREGKHETEDMSMRRCSLFQIFIPNQIICLFTLGSEFLCLDVFFLHVSIAAGTAASDYVCPFFFIPIENTPGIYMLLCDSFLIL
ncbi:hypothetical protein GOODEAATRI_034270 [Goodea atripinnis]|uniref:Uncharacterized protein n=1 Tax=Goodea atripinnis TaxID=208336 RepID=A0ABV0P002_9TELE